MNVKTTEVKSIKASNNPLNQGFNFFQEPRVMWIATKDVTKAHKKNATEKKYNSSLREPSSIFADANWGKNKIAMKKIEVLINLSIVFIPLPFKPPVHGGSPSWKIPFFPNAT